MSSFADYSDPEEFSKAIENGKSGKPQKRSYLDFNTHTPPDITPDTRILAICGIEPNWAAPNEDGWFLSDFFAFYHLFRGLTEYQTWIDGLDLETLVATHGPYLHGNPSLSRKVVLDKAILEQATRAQDLHPVESSGLRLAFKEQLRSHCEAAVKEGQGLLVLIFAQGDGKNGGFWFPSISSTVKEDEIEKIVAGFDIPITVMSTACYSGGWVCNKSFDTENKRALTELDDDDEIGHSEEQQSAYEDFSKTVYETLLQGIDRHGYSGRFHVRAQTSLQ